MNPKRKSQLALTLGVLWGALWGSFLQFTKTGRWLANARTWITVVVGVGGNLLIALLFLPFHFWLYVVGLFAVSSLPIIARSLINEHRDTEAFFDALKDR